LSQRFVDELESSYSGLVTDRELWIGEVCSLLKQIGAGIGSAKGDKVIRRCHENSPLKVGIFS
jgi:hypothetical protein